MPVNDRMPGTPPWPGAVWNAALGWVPVTGTATWPEPFATWVGGEYPVARSSGQESGWKCPGCGRCYSPAVYQCGTCGPNLDLQAAANTGHGSSNTECPPDPGGSMCSCETP